MPKGILANFLSQKINFLDHSYLKYAFASITLLLLSKPFKKLWRTLYCKFKIATWSPIVFSQLFNWSCHYCNDQLPNGHRLYSPPTIFAAINIPLRQMGQRPLGGAWSCFEAALSRPWPLEHSMFFSLLLKLSSKRQFLGRTSPDDWGVMKYFFNITGLWDIFSQGDIVLLHPEWNADVKKLLFHLFTSWVKLGC